MAEALIPRRTINKQEYVLLADITVGTATTSVDITGLNIGKEEEIVLVSDVVNPTASVVGYRTLYNSNTTITNYYMQTILVNSTSATAGRVNEPQPMFNYANQKSFSITNIKLTNNGYITSQTKQILGYGSGNIVIYDISISSIFTVPSITSLQINANVSNAIGIGSRFQLYKVGA